MNKRFERLQTGARYWATYFFREIKSVCFEIFQVKFQISWSWRALFVVDQHVVDAVKVVGVLEYHSKFS